MPVPGGLSAQDSFAYQIGRGMASQLLGAGQMLGGAGQMLGGAGFGPSSAITSSHPGVASSQRGDFAPKPAEAQGSTPVGSTATGGDAPEKTGRSRTRRGGKGKRKRKAAVEDAEMKDVEGEETPASKKVRVEGGEEAAATGGGQPQLTRKQQRAAEAAELADARGILQYMPEHVKQQARLAKEAAAAEQARQVQESAGAEPARQAEEAAAAEQARQPEEAAANAFEEHQLLALAENEQAEQARQAQEAAGNAAVERQRAAHAAEQERLDEHSGLERLQQQPASISVQVAAMRQEMHNRLAQAAETKIPVSEDEDEDEDEDEGMVADEES